MGMTLKEMVAGILILAGGSMFFIAIISIIGTVLVYLFWNLLVVQAFSVGSISFFQALVLFLLVWLPCILLNRQK